jgi:hypothetical protein
MLIIPKRIAGQLDFVRVVSSGFVGQIRSPEKRRKFLNPDAVMKNRILRARRDFADDRRRIAWLRWVIGEFFENFKVPVVKIHAAAIACFGRSSVGQDKITSQRDTRRFENFEPPFFIGIQVSSAFTSCFGIEIRHEPQEAGDIERFHRQTSEVGSPPIFQSIALDCFRTSGASSDTLGAIPSGKIELDKLAVLGNLLSSFQAGYASEKSDRAACGEHLRSAHTGFGRSTDVEAGRLATIPREGRLF